jgi:hypothetical protein
MSLLSARVQPRTEPRTAPRPDRALRPVETPAVPRRRPRVAYSALAVGGALAIGVAQMGVSLASTQDAFTLANLNNKQHELNLDKRALNDQMVALSSPQALAAKADALGLVIAGSASYLRLSDGAVHGAGDGASWISTVTPNGATRVGNALLAPPASADQTPAGDAPADGAPADGAPADTAPVEPALPPTISDGLPSPTTR